MTLITEPIIMQAVDRSVVETIEAFIRFRPGFHGDTGVRDYLYHRLMTNLPDGGTFRRTDGGGTLLAQAEWYTTLKYRRTGNKSSPGRFDVGVPKPEELHLAAPRPLVAFECGRNKKAVSLLRGLDSGADHDGPEPADITKLAREITHKDLPYGYALEFYDEVEEEAKQLIDQLSSAKLERLNVAVLVCIGSSSPVLTLLPASWEESLRLSFRGGLERIERLTCARNAAGRHRSAGSAHGNRVTRSAFLSSCSIEARALIEAIEQHLRGRVKLVFGGNTMTVNRRPRGTLLRIKKASNSICDLEPAVSQELAAQLHIPIRQSGHQIDGSPALREAVIKALDRTSDK